MRRRFIIAHDPDFMTILIHILGNGATAHYSDLFVYIAFAVNSRTAAHDADLVAGKLVTGIADCCSDAAATLVLDPTKA